jgi:hypothetical protein
MISLEETSDMLDALLTVQRILTRQRDARKLALLKPLSDELQDDYLAALEKLIADHGTPAPASPATSPEKTETEIPPPRN